MSNVVSETETTVNVPLPDGRVFAIQPRRGIRESDIPELDHHIIAQLEALRENLSKVCATKSRR